MTDDAIQDILEQTESDPAFQALFDLFDYGKVQLTILHRNALWRFKCVKIMLQFHALVFLKVFFT